MTAPALASGMAASDLSYFTDYEQVNYFTDFEQVKKLTVKPLDHCLMSLASQTCKGLHRL